MGLLGVATLAMNAQRRGKHPTIWLNDSWTFHIWGKMENTLIFKTPDEHELNAFCLVKLRTWYDNHFPFSLILPPEPPFDVGICSAPFPLFRRLRSNFASFVFHD